MPRTRTKKSKKTATFTRVRRSRYINCQQHVASCGPIAVANLIKWHGIETSYRAVLKFCQALEFYIPALGMFPPEMARLLRALKVKFKLRRRFKIKDMDAVLDRGCCIILIYAAHPPYELHCVFVDRRENGSYRAWNTLRKSSPWVSRKDMVRSLRRSRPNRLFAHIVQPLKKQK